MFDFDFVRNPAYTFFHRVGAIFSFYLLYQTQIPDPKRPIPVTYHVCICFFIMCIVKKNLQILLFYVVDSKPKN